MDHTGLQFQYSYFRNVHTLAHEGSGSLSHWSNSHFMNYLFLKFLCCTLHFVSKFHFAIYRSTLQTKSCQNKSWHKKVHGIQIGRSCRPRYRRTSSAYTNCVVSQSRTSFVKWKSVPSGWYKYHHDGEQSQWNPKFEANRVI